MFESKSSEADMSRDPIRRAVMEQLRTIIDEDKEKGWDRAWKENLTPWDAGAVQPPLEDLLRSEQFSFATSGKALVPGCGRGYDAICIATTLGLNTLAVDISETAIAAANSLLSKTEIRSPGSVEFALTDFFSLSETQPSSFELIYDYTFFVAIPPTRRVEWAQEMTKLINPGGYLITLVYPLDEYTETGPPFFVRPEHYADVLGPHGWEKVLDKVPERSSETHVGRERLLVWKKL